MKIKHSKYRNTGMLFELLVRQITADTLAGKESKATNILKKFFVKTELGKEYKLYETLLSKKHLSEGKAEIVINTIIESAKPLNRNTLKRQKYNLIKEISNHYNLDEFFKTKLPNYKAQAALYTLLEIYSNGTPTNPEQIIANKIVLLESLTNKSVDKKQVEDGLLEEFKSYDKDVRILTYKVLLEKFNGKYADLNENQKEVLKEFINSIDSTPKLKESYNRRVNEIKTALIDLNKKVTDKAVKIKINEVANLLAELGKTDKAGDEDLVNLLQYYELLEELSKIHG